MGRLRAVAPLKVRDYVAHLGVGSRNGSRADLGWDADSAYDEGCLKGQIKSAYGLFTIQGVETEWRVVLGQVRSSARVQIRLSASTDWSGSSPLAKVV